MKNLRYFLLTLFSPVCLSPLLYAEEPSEPCPEESSEQEAWVAPLSSVSGTFKNAEEAYAYVESIVDCYPLKISLKLRGSTGSLMEDIAALFMNRGYVNEYHSTRKKKAHVFTPVYNDWAYMNGVAQQKLNLSVLSASMLDAYEKAESIVEAAKEEVKEMKAPKNVSEEYLMAVVLHDKVCEHATYGSACCPSSATSTMLLKGEGVCEGYTRMYSLLLTMAGVENRFICGTGKGGKHAWNLVKLNGQWVHVDTTWDDNGAEASHQYFGLSDEMMEKDHQWDKSCFPQATTEELQYSTMMGEEESSSASSRRCSSTDSSCGGGSRRGGSRVDDPRD